MFHAIGTRVQLFEVGHRILPSEDEDVAAAGGLRDSGVAVHERFGSITSFEKTQAELARVAVSFPTYAEVLVHAAVCAATELRLPLGEHAAHIGVRAIAA
jgi:hypothetical protein